MLTAIAIADRGVRVHIGFRELGPSIHGAFVFFIGGGIVLDLIGGPARILPGDQGR
jgi:hypothetical protein